MSGHSQRHLKRLLFSTRWIWPLILVLGVLTGWAPVETRQGPPKTPIKPVKETLHGVTIIDPYRWLEDQWSPETRAWIKAQNAYTRSILDPLPSRDNIKRRLTELLKIDTVSVPIARGGRYFFTKRRADQDLPIIYMRRGLQGEDEVLIDPHPWSPDHTTSVSILDVSQDGTLLAYGVREGGQDEIAVKLFDVDRRKDLPDHLPKARYFGISLTPDKKGFYYSRHSAQGSRIYYHALGTEPARDREIFGEGYGPGQIVLSDLSEDGRFLLITVLYGAGATKSELYVKEVAKEGPAIPIVKDLDALFSGQIADGQLFIHTNWKAPNGRILRADLKNPAREHWREIIPERQAVIRGFSLAGGKLFVNYLENVVSRVRVFQPDGEPVRDITFPDIGSVGTISGRWESNEAFYAFSSFHIPPTIYRYDVATGKQEVWARLAVPINSDRFDVEQVWYASKDGTRIPMFLMHLKGLKRDGSHPTLLTGYGGFNVSLTPRFSPRAVLWVEHGGVYAVPNLRGGGEFGEKWHRAGMLENKQNVFDDFIAAAEWLIKNGYTQPKKLAISGGSNGGLLVGAALTQRPELFRAVVCRYPLLDMIRYHKFLVAKFWIPEYGSSDDPKQFKYLYAYSPYHHVKSGTKYPAVLFVTGDSDTRVDPLHARKMTARLQAATASDRPILLRYDTKAGHSGGLPVSRQIEELTDELSFLFWQLGVAQGRSSSP